MKKNIITPIIAFLFATLCANAQNKLTVSFTPFTPSIKEYVESLADFKIQPTNATASPSAQPGEGIDRSIDGNMSTIYHSSWNNSSSNYFPITLRYIFSAGEQIDYFVYHPRMDGGSNGHFKEITVYYKLRGSSEVQYKDYDFKGSSAASMVFFDTPLENPEYIKIVVKSGAGDGNGFAACAEMEFYKKKEMDIDLSAYFQDDVCSALQPGITRDSLLASNIPVFFKQVGLNLLREDYAECRIQAYLPYRPVSDLATELKLSAYNQYENPTGVYVISGEPIVVFVPEDTKGEGISLLSREWRNDGGNTRSYALKPGVNCIVPTANGNTYIAYYTSNYATAQPIKIHIYGGKANGVFFRSKHNNEDWKKLLSTMNDTACLDIVGNYSNMAYYVSALKQSCPNDGVRLIELYDEIVQMQFEQMGLFKYNRVPKNHMFSRNTMDGYMSAGGVGANFQYKTMTEQGIGNPSMLVTGTNCWGLAHELGHVNQVRPGLTWKGTTECTNNIYSAYAQYTLTSKYSTLYLRLEHEICSAIEGERSIVGGRFNAHLHSGVLKGENWLFQEGPDGASDHFVKLVPMWQLDLYFKIANQIKSVEWAKSDWYGDVCEQVRQDNNTYTNGQHQINFIKRVCDATETDLTEFFEKAGFLKPVDKTINDYGDGQITITQKMCDDAKAYIATKNYSKPAGVINYISGNTVGIYANKLPVTGTKNVGFTPDEPNSVVRVNHQSWQNAVVYETYAGEELIRITMAGTGYRDNSTTVVPFPANATKVVAVSWDGVRTLAYEK